MKANFKKLFKIFFLLVSAIVFLFVFLPGKFHPGKRREKVIKKKQQRILKKRVYYSKENVVDEECFEELDDIEDEE